MREIRSGHSVSCLRSAAPRRVLLPDIDWYLDAEFLPLDDVGHGHSLRESEGTLEQNVLANVRREFLRASLVDILREVCAMGRVRRGRAESATKTTKDGEDESSRGRWRTRRETA